MFGGEGRQRYSFLAKELTQLKIFSGRKQHPIQACQVIRIRHSDRSDTRLTSDH